MRVVGLARVALIWVETNPCLLENQVPTGAPWSFLGRPEKFAPRFDEILKETQEANLKGRRPTTSRSVLTPPWQDVGKRSFWTSYFAPNFLAIDGARAWKGVLPLRLRFDATFLVTGWSGRFYLEGYVSPLGLAIALHADFMPDTPVTIDQLVDVVRALRVGATWQVRWEARGVVSLSLSELVKEALEDLRKRAMGPKAPVGLFDDDPFTIVTIVRGTDDADPPPHDQDAGLRRALQGLAAPSPTWRVDALTPLDTAKVVLRSIAPAQHLLFATKRGRAVWFPDAFQSAGNPSTLGCYHRNQFYGALQVENLSRFVASLAPLLTHPEEVPYRHMEALRLAAGLLGRTYGGVKTYRSRSLRRQVDDNGWKPAIETVRAYFGMDPLK
mgnify:CR=1 FL=1